jgi:hypothetical protein
VRLLLLGQNFEVTVKALHPIERSQVSVQPNAVTRFGLNDYEHSRKDFPAKGSAALASGII